MTRSAGGLPELPRAVRVRPANERLVRPDAAFVLYWMIAARRPAFNFALDRAVAWACLLRKPLVVLEALRVDYPWASDRLHRFVLDGMADNAAAFARSPVLYYPYVEHERGQGRGLLKSLGRDAAVIVTDDYPCFFLPHAVAAAAEAVAVLLESVDSNGILPIRLADHEFTAAVHFRRHMQRQLRGQLLTWPNARPFAIARLPRLSHLPSEIERRWPRTTAAWLGDPKAPGRLPIDHKVPAVATTGGHHAARRALKRFVGAALSRYHTAQRHPDEAGTSRLSPYLHFGHISAHEVFDAVMKHERWSSRKLAPQSLGRREGWWGAGPGAEAFLDQLIVWRELGFNACVQRPDDYDSYDSLPSWALQTLARHARDRRPFVYTHDEFESAATHDQVWNAAQRELVSTGWMHNSMRMLWGKKILEWSATPREALDTMISIMNRWALDGRDPNSYAGYLWTLGRYDRPWPERPIYGKVRTMSSDRTVRKLHATGYVRRYSVDRA